MSFFRSSDEVNYWPSITDMFMAFFVIALALLSLRTSIEIEGEKYILDDVIKESNELFSRMEMPLYEKKQEVQDARPQLAQKLMEAYALYRHKTGAADMADSTFIRDEYWDGEKGDAETEELAKLDYKLAVRFVAWQILNREWSHDSLLCDMWRNTPPADEKSVEEKLRDFFRSQRSDDMLRHVNSCLQTAGIGVHVDAADEKIGRLSDELHHLREELKDLEKVNKDLVLRRQQSDEEKTALSRQLTSLMKETDETKQEKIALSQQLTSLMKEVDETKQKLVAKEAREQHVVLDETRVRFVQNTTDFASPETAAQALDSATLQLVDCLRKNLALSSGFAVEIIGHTDTTPNGAVNTPTSYRAAMQDDASNPKLGLLRADKVMSEIRARLLQGKLKLSSGEPEVSFRAEGGREDSLECLYLSADGEQQCKPVSFRCYSGSWLAPLKEGAYQDYASNRRVEMFIRPVHQEKGEEDGN